MNSFKPYKSRTSIESYRRTHEDRIAYMQEQLREGKHRSWVQDDPHYGLRQAWGTWEVYVYYAGKKRYLGSSMDKDLAIELRTLGLWYKDQLIALEKRASREGHAVPEGSKMMLEQEYNARGEELYTRIRKRNMELKRIKREAQRVQGAQAPCAGSDEGQGPSPEGAGLDGPLPHSFEDLMESLAEERAQDTERAHNASNNASAQREQEAAHDTTHTQ